MLAAIPRWPNSGVRSRGMTFESSNNLQTCRLTKVQTRPYVCGALLSLFSIFTRPFANFHQEHGCLLEMRPWGSGSYSRAYLEISCSARAISGQRDVLENALTVLNAPYAQVLVFADCPMLEVPTAITTLHSLVVMTVYNSTINSWDDDAALTESAHPDLQLLFFIRSNMSAIPNGLLSPNFPSRLWDFKCRACNLTTLQLEISIAWRNVFVFVFEGNPRLTEFPTSIAALPGTGVLYLALTGIETRPDDAISRILLSFLVLNGAQSRTIQRSSREESSSWTPEELVSAAFQ